MQVVCDASPLRYLILVGCLDALHDLFPRVAVPPAVLAELGTPRTPEAVRRWLAARPAWLEPAAPTSTIEAAGLGLGEREAISLAEELRVDAVLIDDRDAARHARRRGLIVLGTLAVLDEAAHRGFITDLAGVLDRLVTTTNFRTGPAVDAILGGMLRRDAERRHPTPESGPA